MSRCHPLHISRPKLGYGRASHLFGWLGVLAGDHVKSAADAGLPLVGMSLLYREGAVDSIWMRMASNPKATAHRPCGPPYEHGDIHPTSLGRGDPVCHRLENGRGWRIRARGSGLFPRHGSPNNTTAFNGLGARLYGGDDEMGSDRNTCWAWAVSKRFRPSGMTLRACTSTRGTARSPCSKCCARLEPRGTRSADLHHARRCLRATTGRMVVGARGDR